MRVSIHLTGRPSSIAAAAATTTSGAGGPLLPNAPPVSASMTWIDSGGRSSACASPARGRWMSCADSHTRSTSPSIRATQPRGSIGAATARGTTWRVRTTCSAAAKAASTSPPTLCQRSSSSGSASNGSYSTTTCSSASSASARARRKHRGNRLPDVADLAVSQDRVRGVRDLDPRRHDQRHRPHVEVVGGDDAGRRLDPQDPRAGVPGCARTRCGAARRARCRRRSTCGRAGCARPRAAASGRADEHWPTASRITRRAAMPSAAPVSTTASPRTAAPNSASSSASMSRGSNSTGSPFERERAHLVDPLGRRPDRAQVGAVVEHARRCPAAAARTRAATRRSRSARRARPTRTPASPPRRRRSRRRCAHARSGRWSGDRAEQVRERVDVVDAELHERPAGVARALRAPGGRRQLAGQREAGLGEHDGAELALSTSSLARRAAPSRRKAWPTISTTPASRRRRGSARPPRRCRRSASRRTRAAPRAARGDRVLGVDVVGRGDEHAVGVLDRLDAARARARSQAAASRGAHMPAPISATLKRAAPAASRRPAAAPCTGTFAHTWLPSSNSTNSPCGAASAARLVSSHGIRRSSLPVTNRAGLSSCSTHAVEVELQRPRGGRPPRRRRATCARTSRASGAAGGPRSRRRRTAR